MKLTGKKFTDKVYYWHTGYPGGIKDRTARQLLEGRFPERVARERRARMIPARPARPSAAEEPPRLRRRQAIRMRLSSPRSSTSPR